MTQNQWMKGCPEGGEQGFLFSLYSQLIEGKCPCPSACGYSITRTKSHFFAIFVSSSPSLLPNQPSYSSASPLSRYISITCGASCARSARSVSRSSALRAANQLMVRGFRNQRKVRMTMISSIVPICRASFLALVLRCSSSYITTNFKTHLPLRTRSEPASVGKQIRPSILP